MKIMVCGDGREGFVVVCPFTNEDTERLAESGRFDSINTYMLEGDLPSMPEPIGDPSDFTTMFVKDDKAKFLMGYDHPHEIDGWEPVISVTKFEMITDPADFSQLLEGNE